MVSIFQPVCFIHKVYMSSCQYRAKVSLHPTAGQAPEKYMTSMVVYQTYLTVPVPDAVGGSRRTIVELTA